MPASAPVLPRDGDLRLADALRFLAVDAVEAAKSGHPGMPLGMADVVTALFAHVLKFDAGHPTWADRDRFVLSGGHGSALLYALLHLTGHAGMPLEALKSFRRLGSVAAGHPEIDPEIGIETTTGPLGQGFATAVGMALAERLLAARFGDDLVDHRTWVTCGDGDLMEGVSHEAASLAGHLRLSKLTLIWDDNRITIDGATDVAVSDDVPARFRAYGWNVVSADGHDPASIAVALVAALRSDRPTLVAARTTIGFGAPGKAGTSAVHGAPLGAETLVATRAALGWTHGPFEVPADLRAAWAAIGRRGGAVREAWEARLAARPSAARAAFLSALAGDLPGLDALVRDIKAEAVTSRPKLATRVASGRVLDRLAPVFPDIVGGSADLTPSNNTRFAGAVDVRPGDYSGRYVHWGVREAGMAAALNGLAAHGGVIPYGGTFLCFADYARPALRLAALQKLRTIFVGTHDSIGLGEDGPTHQPVEHLAALRAIPNLLVLRPCDLVETAECWQIALESRSAPSVLALSRQELPTLRDNGVATNLCRDGAYVLREAAAGPRRVTLVASGSEVAIAAEARDLLEADGVGAALVSMPCAELFLARPAAERARVLGEGVLRVGVEAAVGFGWGDVLGEHGLFVGLPGFGASGRADDLYRHFGITPEAIVTAVRARL